MGTGPPGSEGRAEPGSLQDQNSIFTCSQGPGRKGECSGPPFNLAFNFQSLCPSGALEAQDPPRKLGLGPLGSGLEILSHLFSKTAPISKDRKCTHFWRLAETAVGGSRVLALLSIYSGSLFIEIKPSELRFPPAYVFGEKLVLTHHASCPSLSSCEQISNLLPKSLLMTPDKKQPCLPLISPVLWLTTAFFLLR